MATPHGERGSTSSGEAPEARRPARGDVTQVLRVFRNSGSEHRARSAATSEKCAGARWHGTCCFMVSATHEGEISMTRTPFIAAFLALGALSLGCLGADEHAEHLGVGRLGIGGLGGLKHSDPEDYQAYLDPTRQAMALALGDSAPNDHEVSPDVVLLGLFGTPEGQATLDQAVSCALAGGDFVTHTVGRQVDYFM